MPHGRRLHTLWRPSSAHAIVFRTFVNYRGERKSFGCRNEYEGASQLTARRQLAMHPSVCEPPVSLRRSSSLPTLRATKVDPTVALRHVYNKGCQFSKKEGD